ncbi:MAG TPA: hypothetical protein VKR61_08330 [Bryobacteraceae bacterium]|nr:hypothetical protein [Bryobacteraceae bacterium]
MSENGGNWRAKWWELPPLILHPFGRSVEAAALFDSVKLSMHLAGLSDPGPDKEPLLRGRCTEFRMLCLLGKDVMRWVGQCVDFTRRDAELTAAGIKAQSFTDLLVNHTPLGVATRFENWGVGDYRRILSRAVGINAVFANPPDFGVISADFLEDYYAYADCLFACYQRREPFTGLGAESFGFALYTSDEYMSTLGCGPDGGAA